MNTGRFKAKTIEFASSKYDIISSVVNKEKYITVEEAAKKWGKTARNVRLRCQKGHVVGATFEGRSWLIPADAMDPASCWQRNFERKERTVKAFARIRTASLLLFIVLLPWAWLMRDGLGPDAVDSTGLVAIARTLSDIWVFALIAMLTQLAIYVHKSQGAMRK